MAKGYGKIFSRVTDATRVSPGQNAQGCASWIFIVDL